MKIMIQLSICFFLLTLFVPMSRVFAKGSPDKITITGPGLVVPIEITNPEILSKFNPWDGQFLDKDRRIVTETPQVGTRYEVLFYFKDTSGEYQLFYALYYSPALSGARGDIYLPQEEEKWYVMNNETIARKSGWLYASPEWDSFMSHLLKVQQASLPTFLSAVASNLITQIIAGSTLAIILIVSAVTLWLLRRRQQTPA
jgi:hypothetical protein